MKTTLKMLSVFLAAATVMCMFTGLVSAADGFTEKTERSAELVEIIRGAVESAKAQVGAEGGSLLGSEDFLASTSSTATDWMALAMGRFSYIDAEGKRVYLIDDFGGYDAFLDATRAYIEKTYADRGGKLHSAKSTEWHRAILAITALGGDPTSFGTYEGNPIDLIADGSYNCVINPGRQGINGWIFGLIALDTCRYEVPEDAKYPRETFITEILKAQLLGSEEGTYGGWALAGFGSKSDVDITAMAIQALAPYYGDDTVYTFTNGASGEERSVTVRCCVDEALDVLSSMLDEYGGFSSWGTTNVEGIAQVVTALCSLGIDPEKDARFTSSAGKTVVDGLLRFRLESGGFSHTAGGDWNYMANDQATYALVAYWRFLNGLRPLYDMRADEPLALPEPSEDDSSVEDVPSDEPDLPSEEPSQDVPAEDDSSTDEPAEPTDPSEDVPTGDDDSSVEEPAQSAEPSEDVSIENSSSADEPTEPVKPSEDVTTEDSSSSDEPAEPTEPSADVSTEDGNSSFDEPAEPEEPSEDVTTEDESSSDEPAEPSEGVTTEDESSSDKPAEPADSSASADGGSSAEAADSSIGSSTDGSESSPQTGDASAMPLFALSSLCLAAAVLLLKKRTAKR